MKKEVKIKKVKYNTFKLSKFNTYYVRETSKVLIHRLKDNVDSIRYINKKKLMPSTIEILANNNIKNINLSSKEGLEGITVNIDTEDTFIINIPFNSSINKINIVNDDKVKTIDIPSCRHELEINYVNNDKSNIEIKDTGYFSDIKSESFFGYVHKYSMSNNDNNEIVRDNLLLTINHGLLKDGILDLRDISDYKEIKDGSPLFLSPFSINTLILSTELFNSKIDISHLYVNKIKIIDTNDMRLLPKDLEFEVNSTIEIKHNPENKKMNILYNGPNNILSHFGVTLKTTTSNYPDSTITIDNNSEVKTITEDYLNNKYKNYKRNEIINYENDEFVNIIYLNNNKIIVVIDEKEYLIYINLYKKFIRLYYLDKTNTDYYNENFNKFILDEYFSKYENVKKFLEEYKLYLNFMDNYKNYMEIGLANKINKIINDLDDLDEIGNKYLNIRDHLCNKKFDKEDINIIKYYENSNELDIFKNYPNIFNALKYTDSHIPGPKGGLISNIKQKVKTNRLIPGPK